MSVPLLLTLVFLCEIIGSFFIKRWVAGSPVPFVVLGVGFYALSTTIWAYALKYIQLWRAVFIYGVGSAVLFFIIGTVFYHEPYLPRQAAGALFGIIALILLGL